MPSKITIKKKGSKSLVTEIKEFIIPIQNKHLEIAGQLTEQEMKQAIKDSLQRPGSTGNLEDSVFAERISIDSVGVGNVSYLDQKAPYWRAINFGSSHMVGKQMPKGTFSPGDPKPNSASFRDGRFYKGGKYAPIVMNAIEAHNYIERTVNKISTIVERAMK